LPVGLEAVSDGDPIMPDIDRDKLWQEIDGLAQRMGARLLEFRNRGDLAQLRGQLMRLAERHRQLRIRFDAAQGPEWDSAQGDLSREHGDLYDEFVKFEQKLDRDERLHPDRVAGAKSGLV
jgi:hypothetical protein